MLRASGLLDSASVTGIAAETIGEGEGFLGTIVRIRLSYDRKEAAAPKTVIAKFPIGLDGNRGLAEGAGVYEREIRFYRDLADRTNISKPLHYYSAMDANPMLERADQLEPLANLIPAWLIRLMLPLTTRFNSRSKRRYLLLMEDLSPAVPGNQVAGCRLSVAKAIVRNLAVMHAGWWDDPELYDIKWIARVNYAARLVRKVLKREANSYMAEFSPEMPILRDLIPWLNDHIVELTNRLAEPPITLLHGDYRLDNMCVLESGTDVNVTLFDWQSIQIGRGVFDLAYFITGNLPREDALHVERELVRIYHTTLQDEGVEGYDDEICMRDYDISKLVLFYRMIVLSTDIGKLLDLGNDRGSELRAVWLERLRSLIPRNWKSLLNA